VILRRSVVSAPPEASVSEVAVKMVAEGVGALVILRGEELVGIFSERDLLTRVFVPRLDPDATRIADVMTREVATAALEEHVDFCIDKMLKVGCRHLPVVSGKRVIGVLSMRDLLRDEVAEQGDEIRHLRAYLHQDPV
jgi:CBS domain-containing protein